MSATNLTPAPVGRNFILNYNVTNGDRVEWARAALETFAAATGRAGECVGTEGRASVLADLLADLLHLCDADGVNFAAALRMGRMFYNDEVTA